MNDGLAGNEGFKVKGGLASGVGHVDVFVLLANAYPSGAVTLEEAHTLEPPLHRVTGDGVAIDVFQREHIGLNFAGVVNGIGRGDRTFIIATDDMGDPGQKSGGLSQRLIVPIQEVETDLRGQMVEELARIRVLSVVGNYLHLGLASLLRRKGGGT